MPKLTYKGTQKFRHDLFRLEPKSLLRNKSFKAKEVKLESISHTHFFHTFDSNGKPQQYSTPTGGHFHEVKWEVGADGELVATCGPALRTVYEKRGSMQRKKVVRVKWENQYDENLPDMVEDNHTHDVTYLWSEELSADTIRKRRDAQEKQAMQELRQQNDAKSLGITGLD